MYVRLMIVAVFMSVHVLGADGAHSNLGLCDGIEHNANRAHVQLDVDQPPEIGFYAERDLQGTPVLQLDDRGLFVEGQLSCGWSTRRFQETPQPNRVLGFDQEAPCPESPVKSGFGDHGAGTAVLCIEIVRHADGIAEVDFRGAPLYFSLGSLPAGKWSLEPSSKGDDEPVAPPVEWRTYHNEEFGYEIRYPTGWNVVEAQPPTDAKSHWAGNLLSPGVFQKVTFQEPRGKLWPGEFVVLVREHVEGQTLDEWADTNFTDVYDESLVTSAEETNLVGRAARLFRVFAFDHTGIVVAFVHERKIYEVSHTGATPNDPDFEEHGSIYEQMKQSLRLLPTTRQP